MSGGRRSALLLVAAAVAGLPSAVLPERAPAQQLPQERSPARMSLAAIPAWVEAGSVLHVDLEIDPVTPRLEVEATVRERVSSRIVYERTVEGRSLGQSLGSATFEVDDLASGPAGTHRVSIDLGAPESAPEGVEGVEDPAGVAPQQLSHIPLSQEGVYPLDLELRVSGAESATDRLVTHVVVFEPDEPPAPLSVAWVWHVGVELPRRPDGVLSQAFVSSLAPGGVLAEVTAALAAAPDVPVSLAPAPATLEAWDELSAGRAVLNPQVAEELGDDPAALAGDQLMALQEAASSSRHQVVSGTYVRADLTALLDAGLREEVGTQLSRGADVLRTSLGIRPDPRTLVATAVDDGVLSVVRDAGVDRLVMREERLLPLDLDLTLARPFTVRSRGRSFLAASADPSLARLLVVPERGASSSRPSDAALAQRFLAGLSVVALEAPAEERGVVVVPPQEWRPSARLLLAVLHGLRGHPALRATTLDGYFSRVPAIEGADAVRRIRDDEPGRLAIAGETVRATRSTLDALARMVGDDDPAVTTGEQLLLLAQSRAAQAGSGAGSARRYLDGVQAVVHSVLDAVRVPGSHTVSLTAREGRIPVTLVNELGRPLTVRLRLASDKLLFPEGDTQVLELPPRSTTTQFTVETRTAGTFTLTVEVTSPDGTIPIGTSTMRVRSTAVSGAALAVTFGAGIFLFGWWGNHIRRARQRQREEDAAESQAAASVVHHEP